MTPRGAAELRRSGWVVLALWLPGCNGETPPLGGGSEPTSSSPSSSGDPGDSTGALPQTTACMLYLECVAEAAPEELPQAEAQFGPAGSCWSDPATAQQCDATCTLQTDQRCPEGTGGGTGDPPLLCSIEGLAPGTASPVQLGDGPEQLPVEIGRLLERNCGCHYLDAKAVDPDVPVYLGTMQIDTWAGFQAPFQGGPTWQKVQQRAVVELGMPPIYFCDDLDLGSLSAEDHALLGAWLEAGAPDAVGWGGG